MSKKFPHIMAVSSTGGHFEQLLRLRPAWEGMRVTYVTTDPQSRARVMADATPDGPKIGFKTIIEANRWQKIRMIRMILGLVMIFITTRPDVVITTGAAPGYFALLIGKIFRARCVWLDSKANAETLSLAGQKAGKVADLWLTQWEHMAEPDGPVFKGSVF